MSCILPKQQKNLFSKLLYLLIPTFLSGGAFYLLSSTLPLYLTRELANGGLAWKEEKAFPLLGTYFALSYLAPLLGGLLSDKLLGNFWTTFLSLFLSLLGLCTSLTTPSPEILVPSLYMFSLGTGLTKLCLTSAVNNYSKGIKIQYRGFDIFYIFTCLGFILGHFLSFPIFSRFGFYTIVFLSIFCLFLSIVFLLQSPLPYHHSKTFSSAPKKDTPPLEKISILSFALLHLLALPFFILSTQLNSSLSIFVDRYVFRTLSFGEFPVSWFAAIGSLTMIFYVSLRNRSLKNLPKKYLNNNWSQMTFAFFLLGISFVLLSIYAFELIPLPTPLSITYIFLTYLGIFIADSHVRPTLWSSASQYIPPSYQAIAIACSYLTIGLGTELGGLWAKTLHSQNFSWFFLINSFVALTFTKILILKALSNKRLHKKIVLLK